MNAKNTIKKLILIGDKFEVPFLLPPFEKQIDEASFDITKIKNTKTIDSFLDEIKKLNIKYEYAFKQNDKNKIFMITKLDYFKGN